MGLRKGQPSEAFKQGKLQAKDLRSRTPEERKAISAMGVAKRKENAARRKAMKEQLELLLSLDVKKKADKEKLREMGIDPEDMNNQMLMLVSLFRKGAIMGDVPAIKQICDIINNNVGDVPQTQQQPPVINIISTSPSKVKVEGKVQVNEEECDEDDEDWE